MNNSFLNQFSENIKFKYFCFDRVIIRGYILSLFFPAGIVRFLRAIGFKGLSNGVMRILTDQLNGHIQKVARNSNIPIHWWPSEGGGIDGAKSKFVEQKYARAFTGKGNHVFCILTDKEPVRTFACRQLISKAGKPYERVYDCRKPVKQYYIYLHDALLGGPCYLKISSYLPFRAEFYFNGHNAIQLQLDKQNVKYKLNENAFVDVENPEALQKAAASLSGRIVLNRINYWMNIFFKFDKGKYSTRSKFLEHGWYLSQIEISSNIVFQSARFCTSLFERLLDKFHRPRLQRISHNTFISITFSHFATIPYSPTKHALRAGRIARYDCTDFQSSASSPINIQNILAAV